MADVILTTTKRNQPAAIHDGYYHVLKDPKRSTDKFVCRLKDFPGCGGMVYVDLATKIAIASAPHSHQADEGFCRAHVLRRELNEELKKSPRMSVSAVHAQRLKLAHDDDEAHLLPTLRGCERNLKRLKRETVNFDEARSLDEIDVEGEFGLTKKGQRFLLADLRTANPPQDIIVFATDEFVQLLAGEVRIVHMDATFQASPNLFYQLFAIHGSVGGRPVPLVYAFMRRKTQEAYEAVLRCVREKILELVPNFDPARWLYIMTDFERALINACAVVWPEVQRKGCWFHHCQAVFKYICNELGDRARYREKGVYHKFARKLMALALLPAHRIQNAFEELCQSEGYEDRLANYYRDTWLRSYGSQLFSVYSLNERTNNKTEGWHSRINSIHAESKKKGVHATIRDLLKEEQHLCEALVHQHRNGKNISVPRKGVYKDIDHKLFEYDMQIDFGQLSDEDFLKKVVHYVAGFGADEE